MRQSKLEVVYSREAPAPAERATAREPGRDGEMGKRKREREGAGMVALRQSPEAIWGLSKLAARKARRTQKKPETKTNKTNIIN